MKSPDVFGYLDHRAFLRAWFDAKQQSNPRYSHRLFASRAGVSNPSLLHLVMKGQRRITPKTLPGFLRALGLEGEAAVHFERLVLLARAKTDAERRPILEAIRASRRFRAANHLEAGALDYLSDWTLPAIRELAGAPGFRADAAWIAARLRPRVTTAHARRSLETLLRIGLLKEVDGEVRPTDTSLVTPHEVFDVAVFGYHQMMMTCAKEALETVDAERRHYGAVTVRVSEERLAVLKDEVARFQERILALCDDSPEGEDVVQLNLQLFPLTEAR